MLGTAIAREIGWRCDDEAPNGGQPLGHERGVLQHRDAQSRIEAVADQVDLLVAQMQIDCNVGILTEKIRPAMMRLCALYLTRQPSPGSRVDPVARFHLGNGARLERINWLGNAAPRAIQESFGIMVNYLYDHDSIEQNHEAFVRDGTIVRSPDVDALLEP